MNWVDWFKLNGDPFITSPLQSDEEFSQLLVKTSSIEREFASLPVNVMTSKFLKLVVGARGLGKSTVLQYSINLCQKKEILATYIGMYPYGITHSKEPVFETARLVMLSMIQEFLTKIYDTRSSFFSRYSSTILRWAKAAGLMFNEIEGFFVDPTRKVDFETAKGVLFDLLRLLQKNDIRALIAIDNLDKLDIDVVTRFFKGAASQPLFERINASNASVLIACHPDFAKKIESDKDLNFLNRQVLLEPLSPIETQELLTRRIKRYAKNPSRKYLEDGVAFHVCNRCGGVTRDILNVIQRYFVLAFAKKKSTISLSIAESSPKAQSRQEMYFEVVSDEFARNGSEKLLRLVDPEKEAREACFEIEKIYQDQKSKIPVDLAQILIENEIIFSDTGLPSGYKLDFDVYQLLSKVAEKNWKISDFVSWLLNPSTLRTVQVLSPGLKAKRLLERYVSKFRVVAFPSHKIVVMQNGVEAIFLRGKWIDDIIFRLQRALESLEIINSFSREDSSNVFLYNHVYYVLKDFLMVFAKSYAALKEEKPLEYRTNVEWFDWDFIKAAILVYQRDKTVFFSSYRHIMQILQNRNAIRRNLFKPNHTDITNAIHHLEKIILEFSHELDNLIGQVISEKQITEKPKMSEEYHEALRSIVDKLTERMGYEKDQEKYRVFRIDGKLYQKLGFYKAITDTAELDIVRRMAERKKDGRIRYKYIIAEIKRGEKISEKGDLLLFLKKSTDLIEILEAENSKLPKVLKPEYTLWYVSYSGFSTGSKLMFYRTEKPQRTKCVLMDISDLNVKLREYNFKPIKIGKEIIGRLRGRAGTGFQA